MGKILITYGTRPLAQRVKQLLNSQFEIVLSTSEDIPSILSNTFHAIPNGLNPTFAHEVLKLSLDLSIQYILPLGRQELMPFAESKILFEEYGIEVLLPEKELLDAIFVLENPNKALELDVFIKGKSILSNKETFVADFSGLGVLNDDEDEIVLVISK